MPIVFAELQMSIGTQFVNDKRIPHMQHLGCSDFTLVAVVGILTVLAFRKILRKAGYNSQMRYTATLAVVATVVSIAMRTASAQTGGGAIFSRDHWLTDYSYLKHELERRYSHLAWFGSAQSGVELPALDRATRNSLEHARTNAEAASAITAFVAAFHDAHLVPKVVPMPLSPASAEPPFVESAADACTAGAAFGYAPVTRIACSLPFESLPGFRLLSDGMTSAFRSGVIEQDSLRICIVRIPRFRPIEFPQVCESAWNSLTAQGITPSRTAVLVIVDAEWLRTLAVRLRECGDRKVSALIVDVGGNAGGNDLGDWAVRLFTGKPVHSAPLLLSADSVAIPYFDEQLAGLRDALNANADLSGTSRTALERAMEGFHQCQEAAARKPCDMSWVWSEQRPWGGSSCSRLIPSGFSSGWLDYADPGSIDPRVAGALFWPVIADSFRGAWTGPTYVLTDSTTGSAAEMFAALMRDRGIAKTIGTHTHGLGCGFMSSDVPLVLPYSKLSFAVPSCVRLRGDGTDEVAGIAPDLPTLAQPFETARSVAARALHMVASDLVSNKGQ